ncbi:MAG: hypothetical protein AB8B91_05510 [Rubripirellula sp.]
MRKEVKRSLLLWPAVASATITTLSLLGTVGTPSLHSAWMALKSVTNTRIAKADSIEFEVVEREAIDAMFADASLQPPVLNVELSARSEHGARAMSMPSRVAVVFGAKDQIKAPFRDERHELAGLVLQPSLHMDKPVHELADDLLRGEMLAADSIAAKGIIPADQNLGTETVKSLPAIEFPLEEEAASAHELVGPVKPTHIDDEIELVEPYAFKSVLPESTRTLAKRIFADPVPAQVELSPPTERKPVKVQREQRLVQTLSPAGWPATQKLNDQLDGLSSLALRERTRSRDQLVSAASSTTASALWAEQVSEQLKELQSLPRLGVTRAGEVIDHLQALAVQGQQQAELIEDRSEQSQWLRAAHGLTRRLAVWEPVWQVVSETEPTWMVSDQPVTASLSAAINLTRRDIEASGDAMGWTEYLLFDQIEWAATQVHSDERSVLAQRFLSRLDWHGLAPEHRAWLERKSILELADAIRPWARDAVDYPNLLSQLERQESDAVDLAAIDIASAVQALRFAESTKAVGVADAIGTHYRNANVRMAISQKMLQRMVPTMAPKTVPVRTTMFGSRIRGISHIESDLRIALVPSPNTWSILLNTVGGVQTSSTGFNGPVAIRTSGRSQFSASTPITVSAQGVDVGQSYANAQGKQRLRNIETEYDGWPLVGALVRSIASNRYQSVAGQSNRIANRKIEREVTTEIDQQLDTRVGEATTQLSQMILGPLGKLSLDPKVIDMQTTGERLLARYRLAGDWQLGAFTPRPRAPRSSLMSVQIHQSAINNTLEQLVPRDQPMLIQEMLAQGAKKFGQEITLPADVPDDVSVQFAKTRPITVEIEDGMVWVTLRVMRLKRGERIDLTQFIVRASYKPEIDGVNAKLVRDGHLRISGPGMSMRERLPVRAIFNKVLSPNQAIALTLPKLTEHPIAADLAISQLELNAGWVALAVSEKNAPRMATVQAISENR